MASNVHRIAEADIAGAQQAHVTGALAHIRAAHATRMKAAPEGPADKRWRKAPKQGDFFFADSTRPEGLGTSFRAAYDDEAMCFLVDCPEPKMDELRENASNHDPRDAAIPKGGSPGGPAVWTDDSVEIYVAPENDHHGYWRFVLSSGGAREATYTRVMVYGWKFDIRPASEKLDVVWQSQVAKRARGWTAYFRIPFESMRLSSRELPPTWGMNVVRLRTPAPVAEGKWNQTFSGPHFPLNSGVLCLGESGLHVERVTFGREGEWQVKLSENEVRLHVENTGRKKVAARARVEAWKGKGEAARKFSSSSKKFTVGGGESCVVKLGFKLHYLERGFNRARLIVEDARGKALYAGSYGFGAEGLRAYTDFPRTGAPSPNPKRTDPDFYEKKLRHIITTLPKFVRKTTADGAPSDFFLEAGDGSVAFDLMEAGCLQKIADWIYGLYTTDQDRLAGVVHFINQPAVVNYSFANTRLAGSLSPLSMLRLGGGQCCCFSNAVLGVCEKMKCDLTGKPYRGWRWTIPGHVMTVVLLGDREVLLDGSAGRFYYTADNRHLAGPSELRADHSLVERAGNDLARFFPKHTAGRSYMTHRTAWPNGAPIE